MERMSQEMQHELNNIWKQRLLILSVVIGFLIFVFYSTIESMVHTWWRSETFTHGFLILPISLYLIWQKKNQIKTIEPVSQFLAIPLITVVSFIWLSASLVDVLVVQQWAFVTLLILSIIMVFGWTVVKQILFPLLYLYFMVPFGEQFITPMMHMTAKFVISAIELTGIPIYAEGTFFTLPTGNWSVVEGCSGVRYLIASIALGTLYAYLTYTSYLKRSLFILASIVFPVIANWLRAFLIVMLGHFSGMKLATGVDHIIYGWFFFGIVLFIMFWVGSYWADSENEQKPSEIEGLTRETKARFSLILMSGLLLVSIGPFMDHRIKQNAAQRIDQVAEISLIENLNWEKQETRTIEWTPRYINPTVYYQSEYKERKNKSEVGLYIAYYSVQKQGSELVNSQNIMIPQKHKVWSQLSKNKQSISIQGQPTTVFETHLRASQDELIIWHWNVISGNILVNDYEAKMVEAINKLSGNEQGEYAVVVYSRFENQNKELARKKLQKFVDSMYSTITDGLNKTLKKSNP